MKKQTVFIGMSLMLLSTLTLAHSKQSRRIPQLDNAKVKVWKTIVYPSKQQSIAMHRHDHDRVVVALTDGTLKVKNDKGKVHYLHFKKEHAYFLAKDVPNELHSDQNMSNHPIKVIVVELKH